MCRINDFYKISVKLNLNDEKQRVGLLYYSNLKEAATQLFFSFT